MLSSSVTWGIEAEADELWLGFSVTVVSDDNCVRIKWCRILNLTEQSKIAAFRTPTRLFKKKYPSFKKKSHNSAEPGQGKTLSLFKVVLRFSPHPIRVIENIHNGMGSRCQPSLSPFPLTSLQDGKQLPYIRSDNSVYVFTFFSAVHSSSVYNSCHCLRETDFFSGVSVVFSFYVCVSLKVNDFPSIASYLSSMFSITPSSSSQITLTFSFSGGALCLLYDWSGSSYVWCEENGVPFLYSLKPFLPPYLIPCLCDSLEQHSVT